MAATKGPRDGKSLVIRLYKEGFANPDPRTLNRFFAPNYKDHSFFGDLKGMKAALQTLRTAHPNLEWRLEHVVAEGDKVAVRASLLLKNAGGIKRAVTSTSIYRIAQGKIVEHWGNGDTLL